jgi:hypothetical protein
MVPVLVVCRPSLPPAAQPEDRPLYRVAPNLRAGRRSSSLPIAPAPPNRDKCQDQQFTYTAVT